MQDFPVATVSLFTVKWRTIKLTVSKGVASSVLLPIPAQCSSGGETPTLDNSQQLRSRDTLLSRFLWRKNVMINLAYSKTQAKDRFTSESGLYYVTQRSSVEWSSATLLRGEPHANNQQQPIDHRCGWLQHGNSFWPHVCP